eukprot:scaffold34550_cov54-Cyclotella_meneghiniana.AAC.4
MPIYSTIVKEQKKLTGEQLNQLVLLPVLQSTERLRDNTWRRFQAYFLKNTDSLFPLSLPLTLDP